MSIYQEATSLKALNVGWDRVKRNRPAAGVDGITWEQFQETRKEEIAALAKELDEHTYEARPVKTVVLYKGEKAREIALYCMRDKVLQQSLAVVLNDMFQPLFSGATYAYRSGKSALQGIQEIEHALEGGKNKFYLKADITKFFDSIRWDRLEGLLRNLIREEDVLELIRMNSASRCLDEKTGDISEKRIGIFQGSGIAPVLSNIYLMEFDHWLEGRQDFFLRYSDDMILLDSSRDTLTQTLQEINARFDTLGLRQSDKKTALGTVEQGFDFLGYHFDSFGKSIPAKAEENLEERLETMWFTSGDIGMSAKCKKALEILGGWEQYYQQEKESSGILEYTALVYAANRDLDKLNQLKEKRMRLRNSYPDICHFLAETWGRAGLNAVELYEYEDYYGLTEAGNGSEEWKKEGQDPLRTELLKQYRKYFAFEEQDTAAEIMQCYTDLGQYGKAAFWQEKITEHAGKQNTFSRWLLHIPDEKKALSFDRSTARRILRQFAGREDMYCLDMLPKENHRRLQHQPVPLTEEILQEHLSGRKTVATYVQRPNATVRSIVFDIDVSRKVLLQHAGDRNILAQYKQKALDQAAVLLQKLRNMGLNAYVEDTGGRGYHVWLLIEEWIPVRYATLLCDIIEKWRHESVDPNTDITMEFFPNKTRCSPEKPGQRITLPLGLHAGCQERSVLLDEDGKPVQQLNPYLDTMVRNPLSSIKKAIAKHQTGDKTDQEERRKKPLFQADVDRFGEVEEEIRHVLEHCHLQHYLCSKAMETGYLTHFERLSVLYVFGHLGDVGKAFVHQVMGYTLNYQHSVTEKFIRKCPEKPVSCVKLREQYKTVTAEIGCSCVFRRIKNCYPSPVLHAVRETSGNQNITLPISRALTEEKKNSVIAEMNNPAKIEGLLKQLTDIRKQQRDLEKHYRRIEKELSERFNEANTDRMEMEWGTLERMKTADGKVEWRVIL